MQAHLPWQRPDDKEQPKHRPNKLGLGPDVLYIFFLTIKRHLSFDSIRIPRLHKSINMLKTPSPQMLSSCIIRYHTPSNIPAPIGKRLQVRTKI